MNVYFAFFSERRRSELKKTLWVWESSKKTRTCGKIWDRGFIFIGSPHGVKENP